MLAHDAVQRRLLGKSRYLMQGSDVAKTDDGFGDRRNTVDNTLKSVPAARAEDRIHRRVLECRDEVRQTILIGSGKPSPRVTRMRALAHYISPRAQAIDSPVDIRGVYHA